MVLLTISGVKLFDVTPVTNAVLDRRAANRARCRARSDRAKWEVIRLVVADLRILQFGPEAVGRQLQRVVRAPFETAGQGLALLLVEDRAESDAAGRGRERPVPGSGVASKGYAVAS